jgi:peptidase E
VSGPGHIVAAGGGGFQDPVHGRLFRFMLELSGRDSPRACFIGTASGDNEAYATAFLSFCAGLGVVGEELALYRQPFQDGSLEAKLERCDVFYVGGGNTRNLIALWREYGLDALLKRRWQAGAVLGGSSAGACCWFETCVTDSMHLNLDAWPGLGWLPGGYCPHFDGEPMRRPRTAELLASGELHEGIACDDNVAAHYEGTHFQGFVSARYGACGWRLAREHEPAAVTPREPA